VSDSSQYQVAEGIDAVIVDSVLGITNGLIQRQNKGERTPGPSPIPAPVADKAAIRVPVLEQVKPNNAIPNPDPGANV
jgi:glycerophosphodiester phosphodiesterase